MHSCLNREYAQPVRHIQGQGSPNAIDASDWYDGVLGGRDNIEPAVTGWKPTSKRDLGMTAAPASISALLSELSRVSRKPTDNFPSPSHARQGDGAASTESCETVKVNPAQALSMASKSIAPQGTTPQVIRASRLARSEQEKVMGELNVRDSVSKALSGRLLSLQNARRKLELELAELGADAHDTSVQCAKETISSQNAYEPQGGLENEDDEMLDGLLRCLLTDPWKISSQHGEGDLQSVTPAHVTDMQIMQQHNIAATKPSWEDSKSANTSAILNEGPACRQSPQQIFATTEVGAQVGFAGGSWSWVHDSLKSLSKAMAILEVAEGARSGIRESHMSVYSFAGSVPGMEKSIDVSQINPEAESFLSRSSYEMSSLWHGLLGVADDGEHEDDDDDEAQYVQFSDRDNTLFEEETDGKEIDRCMGESDDDRAFPRSMLGSRALVVCSVDIDELPPLPTPPPVPQQQPSHLLTHLQALPDLSLSCRHSQDSAHVPSTMLLESEGENERIGILAETQALEHERQMWGNRQEGLSNAKGQGEQEGDGDDRKECDAHISHLQAGQMHQGIEFTSNSKGDKKEGAGDKRIEALKTAVEAVHQDVSNILALMRLGADCASRGHDANAGPDLDAVELVGRNLLNHSAHIEALSTSIAIIPPLEVQIKTCLQPLAFSIARSSTQLSCLLPAGLEETMSSSGAMSSASIDHAQDDSQDHQVLSNSQLLEASLQSDRTRVLRGLHELDRQIAQIENARLQLELHDMSSHTLDCHGGLDLLQCHVPPSSAARRVMSMSPLFTVCICGQDDERYDTMKESCCQDDDQKKALNKSGMQEKAQDELHQGLVVDAQHLEMDAAVQVSASACRPEVMACTASTLPELPPETLDDLALHAQDNRSQTIYTKASLRTAEVKPWCTDRYSTFVDRKAEARADLAARLRPTDRVDQVKEPCPSEDVLVLMQEQVDLLVKMETLLSAAAVGAKKTVAAECMLKDGCRPNASAGASSDISNHTPEAASAPRAKAARFCSAEQRSAIAARLRAKQQAVSSQACELHEELQPSRQPELLSSDGYVALPDKFQKDASQNTPPYGYRATGTGAVSHVCEKPNPLLGEGVVALDGRSNDMHEALDVVQSSASQSAPADSRGDGTGSLGRWTSIDTEPPQAAPLGSNHAADVHRKLEAFGDALGQVHAEVLQCMRLEVLQCMRLEVDASAAAARPSELCEGLAAHDGESRRCLMRLCSEVSQLRHAIDGVGAAVSSDTKVMQERLLELQRNVMALQHSAGHESVGRCSAQGCFKGRQLRGAFSKVCRGLSELQVLRQRLVHTPCEAVVSPIAMDSSSSTCSWTNECAGPADTGLVLDLSATDDEDDLLVRIRMRQQKSATELDLSGCPCGPDTRIVRDAISDRSLENAARASQ